MQKSQAVSVAFQRAFTDGAASTVCLPFPMTSIAGGTVYGFVGVTYNNTDAWYDLSGRKLAEKPTQRGIYINGNKKVVIK